MKTIVKAKSDYRDELEEGELYEVELMFRTDKTNSGLAVVIDFDEEMRVYDLGKFFDSSINFG